ncbi:MAG: hypothetical protein CME70_20675 [Halobacteriovorax sp.]|nr:hypothetical protein [Halobacteriovorax sp.]|tara:strand:- start:243 stop:524 length:282 start_codon:yes stop_codon:yes gene_type:complete
MADEAEKDQKSSSSGTTITGVQLLVGVIFVPVVMVWLALGARIIWSATGNPETLDQIEGLLTALAVLSLPVSAGLGKLFEAFSSEIEARRRDE